MTQLTLRNYGTPRALATAICCGATVCSDCGAQEEVVYTMMGSIEPWRCAECFDNHVFAGKPEARRAAEAYYADVMRWIATGATPNRY